MNGMDGQCEVEHSIPVEQGRVFVDDRKEWSAVVNA